MVLHATVPWGALFPSVHLHPPPLHFNSISWVLVPVQMSDQTQPCQSVPPFPSTPQRQSVPVPVLQELISQPAPLLQGTQQPSQGGMSHPISLSLLKGSPTACSLSDGSSALHTAGFPAHTSKMITGKSSHARWVSCETSCHRTLGKFKIYNWIRINHLPAWEGKDSLLSPQD